MVPYIEKQVHPSLSAKSRRFTTTESVPAMSVKMQSSREMNKFGVLRWPLGREFVSRCITMKILTNIQFWFSREVLAHPRARWPIALYITTVFEPVGQPVPASPLDLPRSQLGTRGSVTPTHAGSSTTAHLCPARHTTFPLL